MNWEIVRGFWCVVSVVVTIALFAGTMANLEYGSTASLRWCAGGFVAGLVVSSLFIGAVW